MGGMYDFSGDGRTDLGEEFIAYKMYEDVTKNDSDDSSVPVMQSYGCARKSGIKLWHIILIIIAIILEISAMTNPYK